MKTLVTQWWEDKTGPKRFYAHQSRLVIYECPLSQMATFFAKINIDLHNNSGIYIFFSEFLTAHKSGQMQQKVYIGESSSLKRRLNEHQIKGNFDFIDKVIIITADSQTTPFSKEEIQFIEAQLIQEFSWIDLYQVQNNNKGQSSLNDIWKKADLLEEIAIMKVGLNALGITLSNDAMVVNSYAQTTNSEFVAADKKSLLIYTKIPKSNQIIKGKLNPNNTVTIFANQSFSHKARSNKYGQKIITRALAIAQNEKDKIKVTGDIDGYNISYLKDVTYTSHSSASYLLFGGATPGIKVWKKQDNDQYLSNSDLFSDK